MSPAPFSPLLLLAIADERLHAIAEEYGSVEKFVGRLANQDFDGDDETALEAATIKVLRYTNGRPPFVLDGLEQHRD